MTTVEIYQQALDACKQNIENEVASSRERSMVLTKLDEAILWLSRCSDTA